MSLSIAVIGAGGIGSTHAELVAGEAGADVAAVCDVDADRAESLSAAVGARAYTDYRELFEAEELDAAYVTTPPGTRLGPIRAAAKRGIAVFCEKPLATTVERGREIADVVDDRGIPFAMGFCLRFSEPCLRLRTLVEDGAVGDPVALFSSRAGWGVPEAGNWRVDPDRACGIAVESVSHNLDLLRWLGGEVASASGEVTNVTHPELDGFDDNAVATLRFESGAIGAITNSWTSRLEHLRHGVVGTDGAVVVEGDGWWRQDRLTYAGEATRHRRTTEFDEETATDMGYRGENRAFLDAVRSGDDPPVGVEDGLRALELSHEIRSR